MRSCGIHLRAISQEMLKTSILDVSLKITNLRLARDQWVNCADCITDHAFVSCYILQTFAMPPQPWMQFDFTAQYTGKSVCQLVQWFRVNYIGSLHWSKHLAIQLPLLFCWYYIINQALTLKQLGFFSKYNLKLFTIIVMLLYKTGPMIIYSTLWILMASLK